MTERMSSRERWLGALRREPLDRLPFWAKLGASYARSQAGSFAGMSLPELHAWMGSEPHGGVGACLHDVRSRTALRVVQTDGRRATEYVLPGRVLRMVDGWDADSQSWHPVEFPVHTREDVEVLTEWMADGRVELDDGALRQAQAVAADPRRPCLAVNLGTSPLMDFLQHLAGVDQGQYLLADCPAEVSGLFAAMHGVLRRKAETVCATTPADFLYLTENTSTTLHSPAQFKAYASPYIREVAGLALAHDKPLLLHMCGHLKALLPELETLPVAGFEAFTSPAVGNTTLADGRAACPGKCLIGGTNAALWLQPAERIIATLERDLDALPHHRGLIPSSAGMMPPGAKPATVKAVVDWLHRYPARFA